MKIVVFHFKCCPTKIAGVFLQHLSWLIEKHNIPTVFRSFFNDFLVMRRVVRLSTVLLEVI